MRRGITPVVAIALLLGMTVAASGGAYTFISQAQQSAQEDASSALATEVAVRDLRCDDAQVEATLKNTGDTSLSDATLDAYLYRDGTLVTTSEVDVSAADVLEPNGLTTVSLPFVLDPGVRYTVELRFPQDDVTVESTCQARLSGLVGHWDFESKTPGTVADAARDNDGELVGEEADASFSGFEFDAQSNWVSGKIGSHAVEFGGDDEQITLDDGQVINFGKSDFSLSMWINADQLSPRAGLFGSTHTVNLESGEGTVQGAITSSGFYLQLGSGSNNVDTDISLSRTLQTGRWYNIILVANRGSNANIYVNGVQEGSLDISGQSGVPLANDETERFGVFQGAWEYFNGTMDDIRYYNKSLSTDEISQIADRTGDPREGLIGEWTFDEGNGTTAHDTSKWVTGTVGEYALEFDGTDDFVNTSRRGLLDGLSAATVSLWVKKDRSVDDTEVVTGDVTDEVMQISDQTGNWAFAVRTAGNTFNRISGPSHDQQWHHLTAVWNQGEQILYVDGVQEAYASLSDTTLNSPDEPVRIGGQYYSAGGGMQNFFSGSIDDVRVFDTALTADQVAALYNATR